MMTSVFCFRTVHFIYLFSFMYVFLAVLGLRCCSRAFSRCGEQGPPFAVWGLLCLGAGAQSTQASVVAARGLLGASASAVWGQGLSGPTACGIFPDQGLNLCPLPWKVNY